MTPPPTEPHDGLVPLSSLPDGARGRLVSVDAGAGLRARLLAMGLRPGACLKVVHNRGPGPFVVAVGQARIVLGRGVTHRVLVRPTNGDAAGECSDEAAGEKGPWTRSKRFWWW